MERPKNITDQQWQTAVEIYNSAKRQGDKYPELTVAQAALETGWFKKPSGKNNYFGQKATAKQSGTVLRTTEVAGNKAYKTNDKFRDYNTIDEAVSDRIKKWGSKYQDAGNVEEAISRIWKYDSKKGQGVGYATDPEYGNKVKSILGTLGTAGLSSESNQTQEAGYVGMLPNGLPDVYGQPYVAEEETKTETTESSKRTDNANKLGFVADYEELAKQYEQQLQAQQKPILQQEIVEGVQYQPIQQNFQEGGYFFQKGGTWEKQQARMKAEKDAKLKALLSQEKPVYKKKTVDEKLAEKKAQENTKTVQKDNTNVRGYNNAEKFSKEARNKTDKEVAEERQARIDAQAKANEQPFDWSNFRQSLADRSQATGDALRVSNEPNFFDDYLNPAVMIGSMADNLGQAPLRAEQTDSYMPYITAVGTPLAVGAMAGVGTQNTGQFVNNLANPLAGTGDLVNNAYSKGINYLENKGIRFSAPEEVRQGLRTNGFSFKNTELDYKKINPELEKIGTETQYENYLKNNYPDANILYSGTNNKNEIFEKGFNLDKINRYNLGFGLNTSPKRHVASSYGDDVLTVLQKKDAITHDLGGFGAMSLNEAQTKQLYDKFEIKGDYNDFHQSTANKKVSDLIDSMKMKGFSNEDIVKTFKDMNIDSTRGVVVGGGEATILTNPDKYSILGSNYDLESFKKYLADLEVSKEAPKYQLGGIKIDPQGYWNPDNEGKPVIIPSPEITMRGVDYPIYGKSLETGEVKLMTPNNNYFFANTKNVLEQPINFQIGGEFVEIDRGNGKIEKINTDSDEYRALYEEGRVLGREGDTLINPTELEDVTITAFRKTKPESLEPKVQIDEQELQQRLDNPYNFETKKDGTATIKEEVLPGIKAEQKLEDVKKVLKDTTYEQKFNTVDRNNLSYSDLSSLSKEEKDKVVQQTLIENNILKQKPRNQQETATLQKELLQSGYDLGKYGVNKDGVDGQFGDKTNKALENYNNKILENGEELAINILKRKDADTFTNTLQKNDNFYMLSSDEGIKDYQKQYYDKGYFRNKQSDFNFNFSDKDLKKNYKVFSTNFVKPYESETSCYGEECASFVTLDVLNNLKSFYGEEQGGKIFDENQVRGDAWTMNSSIVKNGGETLYNVLGKKPESVKNVKSFVEDKIKSSPNIDSKKLKAGDIVHMYYEKSGNFDKAYKEGDDIFSTHVGILKEDDKGNLVVEHNVNGKVYKNKITDFNNKYAKAGSSKIAITGISRPKYNKKDSKGEKVEYIETSSVNKLNTDYVSNKNSPFFKEVLPLAQESLSVNKNKILSDIPISSKEYDNLEKAIISIMWKESYGNVKVDNPDLKEGNYEAYLKKSFAPIAEKVFNRESSKGLTQLKGDKNINSVIKSNILKNEEDLYDPKKSAVVSLYSLSSKYIYLRDLVAKEGLKISPDELTKLAMLSWNEPINKVGESLSKYKNFDKTWEAYNKNSTHAYSKAFSLYDKAFSKRISSM